MGAAGTGVAIETADIALMSSDLARIPEVLAVAKRALRVTSSYRSPLISSRSCSPRWVS
jgi:cation transport ATPase